jgi:hypothetical protein
MGSNCHYHGLEVYRVTLRREFFWGALRPFMMKMMNPVQVQEKEEDEEEENDEDGLHRAPFASQVTPCPMKKPQRNGEFRRGPFDTSFFGYAAFAVISRSARLTFERGRRR